MALFPLKTSLRISTQSWTRPTQRSGIWRILPTRSPRNRAGERLPHRPGHHFGEVVCRCVDARRPYGRCSRLSPIGGGPTGGVRLVVGEQRVEAYGLVLLSVESEGADRDCAVMGGRTKVVPHHCVRMEGDAGESSPAPENAAATGGDGHEPAWHFRHRPRRRGWVCSLCELDPRESPSVARLPRGQPYARYGPWAWIHWSLTSGRRAPSPMCLST